ncbi:MAG: ArsC family transcriptional regulator [Spirochaetaceae bacterium]|nr:ArsC family transcriptional regulator [Spirochaetaceae bacterium]MBQ1984285.1 ArsC family transcriptional regulator [Spirochaetaceae bacterium]
MAIQIFGTNKNFDCKKAQMWFKERRINFQFIDLKEKQMSPGEFDSVVQAISKIEGSRQDAILSMIDKSAKDYSSIAYLDESDIEEKLFENQNLLKQPIVRNGKTLATVGLSTKVWETWN